MPLSIFYDRVRFTSSSTGTGDVTVGSAANGGFRTPATASVPNGTTVSYVIEGTNSADWETGQGMYVSSGTKLVRLSVDASSNAGALVNFTNIDTVVLDCLARDLNDMLSGALNDYLTTGAGDPLTTGAGIGLTTG